MHFLIFKLPVRRRRRKWFEGAQGLITWINVVFELFRYLKVACFLRILSSDVSSVRGCNNLLIMNHLVKSDLLYLYKLKCYLGCPISSSPCGTLNNCFPSLSNSPDAVISIATLFTSVSFCCLCCQRFEQDMKPENKCSLLDWELQFWVIACNLPVRMGRQKERGRQIQIFKARVQ